MNSNVANIGPGHTQRLLQAAKRGDEYAFEQLIVIYRYRLLKVAKRIMGNVEDAEDAVQTACLKAFVKLSLFREESSFYTWLCRITANECLSVLRSRKAWARTVSIDEDPGETSPPFELPDTRMNPEATYQSKQLLEELHHAIGRLSKKWQQIVRLRHFEELSEFEVATTLQISPAVVKTSGYRARKQLRRHLEASARPLRRLTAFNLDSSRELQGAQLISCS